MKYSKAIRKFCSYVFARSGEVLSAEGGWLMNDNTKVLKTCGMSEKSSKHDNA